MIESDKSRRLDYPVQTDAHTGTVVEEKEMEVESRYSSFLQLNTEERGQTI